MPATKEMAAAAQVAPPRPKTDPRTGTKPKRQPPFAVILHNDNVNGFDFVIRSIMKVFKYGALKAFKLTFKAHFAGRVVLWSGHRELAELKADQMVSCGADPMMKHKGAGPLRVTVEELPGD